ncbi:MAG: histidine phosphatase family protein [Actinomycetota bacterium]
MTSLLVIRHAQSTWNAERRWQGWADVPLSELGERQAAGAAARLRDAGLVSAVASDLRRARRTAELISEGLGLGPVRVDEGFRERDVGEWSALAAEEMEERFPGQRDAWRDGKLDRPPGGESTQQVLERVDAALAKLRDQPSPLLIVSHGGVIRALERRAGLEPRAIAVLSGRWFALDGGELVPGDPVAAGDDE